MAVLLLVPTAVIMTTSPPPISPPLTSCDDNQSRSQAICITKSLPSDKWEVLHDEAREEPWGRARLIIQRKAVP